MYQGKKSMRLIRCISLILALFLIFETSGTTVAYFVDMASTAAESPEDVVVTDAEGNTVIPDESWTQTYPYGAFAFEQSGVALSEGESGVLKVYRLGGTAGRATAYLTYEPVLIQNEEREPVYDYALSADDVVIEVEEPQPIARYQPVGKPADPAHGDASVTAEPDEEGYILALSVAADAYQWQICADGAWTDITDGTADVIPADAEFIDGDAYDYRCVYTLDGVQYCSDSLGGEVYEAPAPEVLEEAPADIELNAASVYTALGLKDEGEEPYAGWAFELIFADGEWVKEIHVDALDDELTEAVESAALTIRDCDGGATLEGANQLLLRVEDTDEPIPSTVGFSVTSVTADKADGSAEIMIERLGGSQRPVSVEYATEDGTAIAGQDYETATGKLMFYAGVTKLPVRVELIDDGIPIDEPLTFTVALSELLGDDACAFAEERATVSLTNSGTGAGENLASQLYDPAAVDVTGAVKDSATAANTPDGAVGGTQVETETAPPAYASLIFGSTGDALDTQSYTPPNIAAIAFAQPANPWTNTADAAQKSFWGITVNDNIDSGDDGIGNGGAVLYGKDATTAKLGSGETQKITSGVALASKNQAEAQILNKGWEAIGCTANKSGQLFSKYSISLKTDCAHDTTRAGYYYSYTTPRVEIWDKNSQVFKRPTYVKRIGWGLLNKNWSVESSDIGGADKNYVNPFSGSYMGTLRMDMPYSMVMSLYYHFESGNDHVSKENDTLNDYSMVWIQSMALTRRTFAPNAFTVELSTPNDENTAPENCATVTQYDAFAPKVSIVAGQGGVAAGNSLYVGSTLKIDAGKAPAGYYVSNLVVYRDSGDGVWREYNGFSRSYDDETHIYTVKLGGDSSTTLTQADLSAKFRFRVAYSRRSSIVLDLKPSVPRKEGENTVDIDPAQAYQVFNGYNGVSNHGFSSGTDNGNGASYTVGANITYGRSTFSGTDFSTTMSEGTLTKPVVQGTKVVTESQDGLVYDGAEHALKINVPNLQWICFNLSPNDLLLVNETPYPGNARIYLSEADMTGTLTIRYYHEDYRTAQNRMSTTFSWMGLYLDRNGNGRIDGYYNTANAGFVLTEVNGVTDEFISYLDPHTSVNELEFAPVKNEAGQYCQFFVKVCYSMTPRSLVVPEGASLSERAQVLPAFITALNPDSAAYSMQTDEVRAYRYLVSGMTKQSATAALSRSSDDHLKYGAEAAARSTVDIPLGGDTSPAELKTGADLKKFYVWTPVFRGNLLYPFDAPTPITIDNSVAGPTRVTAQYNLVRDNGALVGYSYFGEGLNRMNGYLGSFTGTTTFVLVSQEQNYSTDAIFQKMQPGVSLGGGAAATGDDRLYVQSAEKSYYVTPDSVTASHYSTTPDATYLQQMQDDSAPTSDVDMDDSGSEMSEFNVDLGINLGSMDLAVTDYVTILLDGNQVGFAIGLPLGSIGRQGTTGTDGKTSWAADNSAFADQNKGNWTQFRDFFKKGNFGGDSTYQKASTEHARKKSADTAWQAAHSGDTAEERARNPQPANPYKQQEFKSKSFSVDFAVGLAILFEYNPLDNGYYFEGMTVSFEVSLSFRIQARLTVCPIVYFYFQFDASIEIATGLGVIRDAVETETKILDAKSVVNYDKQVRLTYMARPSAGAVLTNFGYLLLAEDKRAAYSASPDGKYYYNSAVYKDYAAAREVYLETGDYFLTEAQYGTLTDDEKTKYAETPEGYHNTDFKTYNAAVTAYNDVSYYAFETQYKAFNIRFSGKLAVDVYVKDSQDEWVLPEEDAGYNTGFISSDGSADTQVVLKSQEGMTLDSKVRVVLRPLDYDSKTTHDVTALRYISEIFDIRNEVYWKGISISPSVGIEIGAGVGVELLKVELYAKVGLEASFLLGVYNTEYDPYDELSSNDKKYNDASVESFGFSIGIGLRVVLLLFTFELDAVTYTVDYDGSDWETGWHFLNDWVESGADTQFGVTVRPPQSKSGSQTFFSPEDNAPRGDGLQPQAYDPLDSTVPFQLSGYGASFDAVNLSEDIIPGGDYKAVSAGGRDFVVYTAPRTGEDVADEDGTMLVMSELKRMPVGEGTAVKYGLANPTGATGENVPLYIVLDDDDTGDTDFDVWCEEQTVADATSYTIHAAWVSYGTKTAKTSRPTEPAGAPYTVDETEIDEENYTTIAAPTEPVAPDERDFYTTETITAEAFQALDEEQKALCVAVGGAYTKYTLTGTNTTVAEATAAYARAQTEYDAARSAYTADTECYDAWYDYFAALTGYNTYIQTRLKTAANNTVLKTAVWSYTSTPYSGEGEGDPTVTNDPAFDAPNTLAGGDDIGYLFAPVTVGDAVFCGSTVAEDAGNAAYQRYCEYLKERGLDGVAYADYLRTTKKSTLDVLGTRSALNLFYKHGDIAKTSVMSLTAGQALGNVEFTALDDGYCVAYTTRQYTGELAGTDSEYITTERLFLRKVTLTEDGGAVWGDPMLLRMTRDYDNDSAQDGLYGTDSVKKDAFESPYFSNLSFLTAQIDPEKLTGTEETFTTQAVEEHTFLLFEMNGATYLILDTDLRRITGTEHKGTIYPFFTGATVTGADGSQATNASGKLEVTIGADQDGTLYAVYVGAVPNTTNNALWMSPYDARTNTWGDGVILAMNNMDAYEASVREGWGDRTTQAAYLGLKSEGGLLTALDIEHLYGEDADIILEKLQANKSALGDGSNLIFSNLQALRGAGGELLILTQATGTTLRVAEYTGNDGKKEYAVMPTYSADGAMESQLGMYAVSYGKGSQNLGEGTLSFGTADFSLDSELYVALSAVNTGDTAFRGSEEQPITATLTVAGQTLATWKIEQSLRSGQKLELYGDCAALTRDLQEDDTFTLTLSEYTGSEPGYENGTTKSLDLFTVTPVADLGVEAMSVELGAPLADGSKTAAAVRFVAGNRGSGPAEDVYAQFSYRSGTDAEGEAVYTALDLRDAMLTIDPERELSDLLNTQAANESTEDNLRAGILYLYNAADGNNDLQAGYGRAVSGTVYVPAAAFTAGESGYLDLRVELCSGADSTTGLGTSGVQTLAHDEYNAANNARNILSQAVTTVSVAPGLVLPLGTTTLVPISAISMRGTRPALSAKENDDLADGLNLGILNFKQSSAADGRVTGVLSITPSKVGNGTIQIYDGETSTSTYITFMVTDAAEGIDIFNDNGAFRFINADGSNYDGTKPSQSWTFGDAPTWGTGTGVEVPLRRNLAYGDTGARFTFSTVAESIDLYFSGSIEVESDYPGFVRSSFSNEAGGKTPVRIAFGENEVGASYSVTVTVKSIRATFDRMMEQYAGNVVPIPVYDVTCPMLIWSRSFPATASIKGDAGTAIPLRLYILDNSGLDYVVVNKRRYTTADAAVTALSSEGRLWVYDFGTLSTNGVFDVMAVDTTGNTSQTQLIVDWFTVTGDDGAYLEPSGNASTVSVPIYDAAFFLDEEPLGSGLVGVDSLEKLNITFKEMHGNTKTEKNTHQVYTLSTDDEFVSVTPAEENEAVFRTRSNNIYWTRTLNEDNTWSACVLCMEHIDPMLPQASLSFSAEHSRLSWQAFKENGQGGNLIEAAINDHSVLTTAGKNLYGTMDIRYNGVYRLTVADAAGNRNSASCTVTELTVDVEQDAVTPTGAWAQTRDNGRIDVDLTNACGVEYHAEDSEEASNAYLGRYELACVAADYDLSTYAQKLGAELVWTPVNKTTAFRHAYTGLVPGDYLVLVRDAANHGNMTSIPVTVADEAIVLTTATVQASTSFVRDGQALAQVTNGSTAAYEFAILFAEDYDGRSKLSIGEFLALDTAESTEDDIVWQPASNAAVNLNARTFTELGTGWYYIAARSVYGVADSTLNTLRNAGTALAEAETALAQARADEAEKPEVEALLQALADAQAAYDAAAGALRTESTAAYAADADLWAGAAVTAAYVKRAPGPRSNLGGVTADTDGTVIYLLREANGLFQQSDNYTLAQANADSDILLSAPELSVFIPKGMLGEFFDVNRLIVDLTAAQSGMVVRYTAPDGTERIVPWCLVEDGVARYMLIGTGDYTLVPGSADFADIPGLWGEDAIVFTAFRRLFDGTGENQFSPYQPMTRAMFVTVLWRMAGKPAPTRTHTFTDLTADWYEQAVAWAVENGITTGYSATAFGPNDPVSREQMCVFLGRFLGWLGFGLDKTQDAVVFSDDAAISAWARSMTDLCTSTGLIAGVGNNTFAPTRSATRMEVSTLLMRLIDRIVGQYCE